MKQSNDALDAWQWWAAQRRRYNIGLVVVGILAFICYAAVIFFFEQRIPDADVTLFTTLFQAIGYLVMMGIANICFFIGPVSEKLLKPKNVSKYRSVTFATGYWMSVLLPFIIPAYLLVLVILQPPWWAGNK